MSTRAHRVHANIDRPDPALVARYRSVWVETVAAVCVRKPWLVDPAIKPLANREWRICGPAVTVLPEGTDTMASIIGSVIAHAEERSAQLMEAKRKLVPPLTLFDLRGGRTMVERLGVEWIDGTAP